MGQHAGHSGDCGYERGCGHEHLLGDGGGLVAALRGELMDHLPFSVSSVAIGLMFAGLICYLGPQDLGGDHSGHGHGAAFSLFHLFHPAHMLFSAAATTAMFWRYDHSGLKAVVVGVVGAVGVCGVSDIGLPFLAQIVLGHRLPLHICLIENPSLVFPFAATGVLVGLGSAKGVSRSTLFSHSLHVLTSTAASIFYLIVPFSALGWIDDLGKVFLFVLAAVMVPCCLSDIVFPLLMTRDARAKASASHHHH